jgi:hypothetical protein
MALRAFIAILFLHISAGVCAQTFEGGYIRHDNDDSEGYYFWKDNEFIWVRNIHGEWSIGRGTYVIRNDSILLNFGTARRQFDIQVEENAPSGSNASSITVNAMHSSGKPVAGLRVFLDKSKAEAVTDAAGEAVIRLSDPIKSDGINFDLPGYRTFNTTITLRGTNNFFAFVVDDAIHYRENANFRFKIKYSRRSLVLINEKGRGDFKHVSRRRFMNLYHRV